MTRTLWFHFRRPLFFPALVVGIFVNGCSAGLTPVPMGGGKPSPCQGVNCPAPAAAHRQSLAVLVFDQLATMRRTASVLLNRPSASFSVGKDDCIRYSIVSSAWRALAEYACKRSRRAIGQGMGQGIGIQTTGQERLGVSADGQSLEALSELHVETDGGGLRAYSLARTLRIGPVATARDGSWSLPYDLTVSFGAENPMDADRLEHWKLTSSSRFSVRSGPDGSLEADGLVAGAVLDIRYSGPHGPHRAAPVPAPPQLIAHLRMVTKGLLDFPAATAAGRCRFPRGSVLTRMNDGTTDVVGALRSTEDGFGDADPQAKLQAWNECE